MTNRIIIFCFTIMVVMSFASPALAGGFDDVPVDHYAYNAVQYLHDRGILVGDEWGVFNGEETMTRYDFAIALARAVGTIEEMEDDDEEVSPDIIAMVEVLENEFSAEMAEIRTILAEHDARISDVEVKVDDLGEDVESLETDLLDLSGKLGNIQFSGDARLRFQGNYNNDDTQVQRPRVRLRLTLKAPVTDELTVTSRLATGDSTDPTGTNADLKGEFAQKAFWVDRLFFTWKPGSDGDWTLVGGKFPPNYVKTEISIDPNINVEGIGQSFKNDDGFVINFAELVPDEQGFYIVGQIGQEDFLTEGLDLFGTYHYINDKAWGLIETKMRDGDLPSHWVFDSLDDDHFSAIDIIAVYSWEAGSTPIKFTGQYYRNLMDTADGDVDSYQDAVWAKLDIGKLSEPGDFTLFTDWGRIEPNSAPSWLTDAARGRGGQTVWVLGVGYRWMKDTDFKVYLIHTDRIATDSSTDSFRFELLTKFK